MTKAAVRGALFFLFAGALGAAAFLIWSSERQTATLQTSTRRFDALVRSLTVGAGDLRAAQQAYVAAGQGDDFWFARVSSLLTDIGGKLPDLKSSARSAGAASSADAAISSVQDLEQVDTRVRDLLHAHQTAQASDLIFADGFDLTHKVVDSLAAAVTAEETAADLETARAHRLEAGYAGGAALIGLVVGLLLVRVPRNDAAAPTSIAPAASRDTLGDLGAAGRPVVIKAPAKPVVDLQAVAALCGDLSRLTDTRTMPGLLERAAEILDANGIVLWIADPDGHELAPVFAHGYPANLTNRLGMMKRDAENVTASAFRTGLLQTVKGDATSNGAVAAPLAGPGGCVGVLAAEMKHGGEQRPALLAATTIIASQLSTLVGPPAARKAEATG